MWKFETKIFWLNGNSPNIKAMDEWVNSLSRIVDSIYYQAKVDKIVVDGSQILISVWYYVSSQTK